MRNPKGDAMQIRNHNLGENHLQRKQQSLKAKAQPQDKKRTIHHLLQAGKLWPELLQLHIQRGTSQDDILEHDTHEGCPLGVRVLQYQANYGHQLASTHILLLTHTNTHTNTSTRTHIFKTKEHTYTTTQTHRYTFTTR